MHCRIFLSVFGLYPLDVSSSLSVVTTPKMSPNVARCPLGDKIALAENHLSSPFPVSGSFLLWNSGHEKRREFTTSSSSPFQLQLALSR